MMKMYKSLLNPGVRMNHWSSRTDMHTEIHLLLAVLYFLSFRVHHLPPLYSPLHGPWVILTPAQIKLKLRCSRNSGKAPYALLWLHFCISANATQWLHDPSVIQNRHMSMEHARKAPGTSDITSTARRTEWNNSAWEKNRLVWECFVIMENNAGWVDL